jgi:hypothetical protein
MKILVSNCPVSEFEKIVLQSFLIPIYSIEESSVVAVEVCWSMTLGITQFHSSHQRSSPLSPSAIKQNGEWWWLAFANNWMNHNLRLHWTRVLLCGIADDGGKKGQHSLIATWPNNRQRDCFYWSFWVVVSKFQEPKIFKPRSCPSKASSKMMVVVVVDLLVCARTAAEINITSLQTAEERNRTIIVRSRRSVS